VTGSRSRACLCFKGTEEGEEEDGLFEDRRAGDQILWKGVMKAYSSLSTTSYRGMGEEPLQRILL